MTSPTTATPGLDAAFLRRVYVASLAMAVLGCLVGAALLSWRWGIGLLTMAVWSVANVRSLDVLLRLAVTPGGRHAMPIALAGILKLPVLYGVGALIVIKGGFPPVSLIAGFSVPLAVILLKILGQWLATRSALDAPASQPPHRS